MENHIFTGGVLLLVQSRQDKFWTLPPFVALTDREERKRGSCACWNDVLASLLGTKKWLPGMMENSIQTLETLCA